MSEPIYTFGAREGNSADIFEMFEGEVHTFSLDIAAPTQIHVLYGDDWTRTGNGARTIVTSSPLDDPLVFGVVCTINLYNVANYLDQRLIIDFAQVVTTRKAEGRELRANCMIHSVVECGRDE